MGASESTASSNGTKEEKDDPHQQNSRSGGSSMGTVAAIGAAAAVGVAVAWGVSKALSDGTKHKMNTDGGCSPEAVAWGFSKALSDGIPGGDPPLDGKHKMNVDGGCSLIYGGGKYKMDVDGGCSLIYGDRGPGYYGGILRNPRGEFVCGFKGYIEESDTLKSELFAVLKGLELLVELELTGSILETDSQAAYQFVTGQGECGKSKFVQDCKSIIENCRKLADENGVSFNLVSRDNNQCADKLANMGKKMKKEGYVEFNELPDELKDLV